MPVDRWHHAPIVGQDWSGLNVSLRRLDQVLNAPTNQGLTHAHLFPGATAGLAIRAAVTSLAQTGGIIDCRGFASPLVLSVDICGNLAQYNNKAYTFLWGPQEVRVPVTQGLRSHHHHILQGATFISKDATGTRVTGITMFAETTGVQIGGPGNGVLTTDGSGVLTKKAPSAAGWAYLETGSPIAVFGISPQVGSDNTTINIAGGVNNSTATITVASTSGFPSTGTQYIRIEDEIISYTGLTATAFTGCTRGAVGSVAAAHADTTAVTRPTYEPFFVESTSGDTITIGAGQTIDLTSDSATGLSIVLGALDVRFDGIGTFDGNRDPSSNDTGNPEAIVANFARHLYIGPGITFQNFDFGGPDFQACLDSACHARVLNTGRSTSGVGTWVFGKCKRITIRGQYEECDQAVGIDDRSNTATLRDGPPDEIDVMISLRRCTTRGIVMSGGRRNRCHILIGRDMATASYGIQFQSGASQWVTNAAGDDNIAIVDVWDGSSVPAIDIEATLYANKRVVGISLTPGAVVAGPSTATLISTNSAGERVFGVNVHTTGLRVGAGTLSVASDEVRLTPSGRSDGVRLLHTGSGNYKITNSSGGGLLNLGENVGVRVGEAVLLVNGTNASFLSADIGIGEINGILHGVAQSHINFDIDHDANTIDRKFYITKDAFATQLFELLENANFAFGPTPSYGSGVGVGFVANAVSAPSANPTGGSIYFVSAGATKVRGTGGTITTIAPA